jgi:phosphoribosylformimino-5-aminoimidazole carboxamide ribotide isomerase
MIIYPAIDMRGGRCVRLRQGDFAAETVFADDPADAARRWAAEGARWLHVVNLDGALDAAGTSGAGSAANLAALERILAAVDVPVQFGGGVRSTDDVDRLLGLGVSRVILGTVAVREPQVVDEALARHGAERVAVGIDARDGHVAIHGWVDIADVRATDLAIRMAAQGVRRVIYTDVRRDGTMGGVNLEATRELARAAGLGVIASGGVATLDDVRALRAAEADGIEGVIIGMAIYRGAVSLAQAIAIAEGEE